MDIINVWALGEFIVLICLSQILLRILDHLQFYVCIKGKGDPDSPPRTPHHKSFHPPIMTENDGNEGEVTPVMVPVQKPPSRTNSVTTSQASKGSSSGYVTVMQH